MDATNFSVEDFLVNESFANYCIHNKAADRRFWEQWLSDHPEKQEDFDTARELLLAVSGHLPEPLVEERLEQFKGLLRDKKQTMPPVAVPVIATPVRRIRSGYWWTAAAVMLGVIAVGYLQFLRPGKREEGMVVYTSGDDKRSNITLADGSTVILYPHSKLTVLPDFNHQSRKLILEGQGFFTVADVANRPFSVVSEHYTTTALGTSFMVRAYKTDKVVKVSLITGKVKVEGNRESVSMHPVILTPGEQFVENERKDSSSIFTFDVTALQATVSGLLVFKDASFTEMKEKLEAFYGVTIYTDIPFQTIKPFTGEFSNQSLNHVLEVIGYVNNLKIRQDSNRIYILAK
jgi:transmembrane sensor